MHTSRLILAAFLLTASFVHAQDAEPTTPEATANTQPDQSQAHSRESFRITMNFKTTDGGKTTTQRTYSLVATTNFDNPGIRDDSRVPARMGAQWQFEEIKTDVDILRFIKMGDSVYIALKISTRNVATQTAPESTEPPIIHEHQYTVSPTLPIGKLTTVYSAVDAVNDNKVDVQLLVQPLDVK